MSYLSGNTVPGLGARYGLTVALGVGALANIGSFIVSCLVVSVDNYAKKHDEKIKEVYNE
jgi:hypothetical protein